MKCIHTSFTPKTQGQEKTIFCQEESAELSLFKEARQTQTSPESITVSLFPFPVIILNEF